MRRGNRTVLLIREEERMGLMRTVQYSSAEERGGPLERRFRLRIKKCSFDMESDVQPNAGGFSCRFLSFYMTAYEESGKGVWYSTCFVMEGCLITGNSVSVLVMWGIYLSSILCSVLPTSIQVYDCEVRSPCLQHMVLRVVSSGV